MRSPAVSSMSSSRPGGSGDTCSARSISSSVVSPMAETTTTTSWPALRVSTMRRATRLMPSASATRRAAVLLHDQTHGCAPNDGERWPRQSRPFYGAPRSVAAVLASRDSAGQARSRQAWRRSFSPCRPSRPVPAGTTQPHAVRRRRPPPGQPDPARGAAVRAGRERRRGAVHRDLHAGQRRPQAGGREGDDLPARLVVPRGRRPQGGDVDPDDDQGRPGLLPGAGPAGAPACWSATRPSRRPTCSTPACSGSSRPTCSPWQAVRGSR